MTTDRINSAYSRCGSKGTLLTVGKLTGLPINYLITVNFHGFKEVVDKLGGVWMDVDRRYYNRNTGSYLNNFANINLQPGYQKLTGQQALDFVRFRHTDDDLHRLARQQAFVRSFREQVAHELLAVQGAEPRQRDHAATSRSPRAGTSCRASRSTTTRSSPTALPAGHVFQDKIDNVVCGLGCSASPDEIQKAVQRRSRIPTSSRRRPRTPPRSAASSSRRRRPPSTVTVTVLNGNGVAGAAANASYLLGQRGYKVLTPPNDLEPNAPRQDYFHTMIYYDKTQARSKAAATALQSDDAAGRRRAAAARLAALRALDPGSMLLVVARHRRSTARSARPTTKARAEAPGRVRPLRREPGHRAAAAARERRSSSS